MATQMKTLTSYDLTETSISPNLKGWLSIIPEEYECVTLSKCVDLPDTLIDFGVKWAETWPLPSLYFFGVYGSGKTTFSFALIRKLIQNLQGKGYFWPNYLSGRELDGKLLKAIKSEEGEEWELEKWSTSDLLYIDDIDKISGTDRFKMQFFEILNRRGMNRRPTIITSNCEPKELGSLLDGSIISRMGDKSKWKIVQFPDKDLRKYATEKF